MNQNRSDWESQTINLVGPDLMALMVTRQRMMLLLMLRLAQEVVVERCDLGCDLGERAVMMLILHWQHSALL